MIEVLIFPIPSAILITVEYIGNVIFLLFVSNSWHLCCCQSTGRSWNKLSRMIQVATSKLCLLNSARFVCLKMASVYPTNKHRNKWGNERTDRLTSKRTNEYEQPSPFIHGLHHVFFVYFHKLTYVNTEVNEIWIKEKNLLISYSLLLGSTGRRHWCEWRPGA